MACYNNKCYLPEPPRLWSRVENSCALITDVDNSNGLVKLPYSGEIVPVSALGEKLAMLNKGNVLQYKANSSNLTRAQKYSKIAKGQWVNRNTTWASQSTRGFTNPNTISLKRVGNINIALDPITGTIIGPTTESPTCPKPIEPVNPALPTNNGGGGTINEPNIPQPKDPSPGSNVFPSIIPETPILPIIIQDGGSLVCSVQENICTGETRRTLSQQICNPTSDSDVPGPIQDLCWNDGTPTWYPRQRYTMSNSTNKWPYTSGGRIDNVTFVSAIKPLPAEITNISFCGDFVRLEWNQSEVCLPVQKFLIYLDGDLISIVDGNVFQKEFFVNKVGKLSFYIISSNQQIISEPSNVVEIDNSVLLSVSNLNYNTIGDGTILLYWESCNKIGVSFNIYKDGLFYANTTQLSYVINGLSNCISYLFEVIATNSSLQESSSESIIAQVLWVNPPTNLNYTTTGNGSIALTWSNPSPNCVLVNNYNIYQDSIFIGNVSGEIYLYNINGLTNCDSYTFSVNSEDSQGNVSFFTSISNAIVYWPNPPSTLNYTISGSQEITLNWTPPNPNCDPATSFYIYQDGVLIGNTGGLFYNYTVTGLTNCYYDFSVSSLDSIGNESNKITINVEILGPNPPTNLAGTWDTTNKVIVITWTNPTVNCSPPTSYNLYYSTDNITFNSISGILSSPYNFIYNTFGTYYFYMTSVNAYGESSPTSTISVTYNPFLVSFGNYYITSYTSGNTVTYTVVIEESGYATDIDFYLQPDSNVNFQLIGAGGGGGGTWSNFTFGGSYPFEIYSGAGGGGGGNLLINNFQVATNTAYSLTVGAGGIGGTFGDWVNPYTATPGTSGASTTLVGTGINCAVNGGAGGGGGGNGGTRALGGAGGSYSITTLSSGTFDGGAGGNGGQGNAGGSGTYTSGTSGTNSYFYNNQSLSYPTSTDYVTYYKPFGYIYNVPNSITLTNWYTFSGGGGGANSDGSGTFAAYPGGSGAGTGGLNGSNYTLPPYPPYPSYGGGGGGGPIAGSGTDGNNGLGVIWFSYTFL